MTMVSPGEMHAVGYISVVVDKKYFWGSGLEPEEMFISFCHFFLSSFYFFPLFLADPFLSQRLSPGIRSAERRKQ